MTALSAHLQRRLEVLVGDNDDSAELISILEASAEPSINGLRRFVDASMSPGPVRYLAAGGDDADDGLTPATAWATLGRAVQGFPWAPEFAGAQGTINVGAGVFAAPMALPGLSHLSIVGTTSVASSFLVDAATPVNTQADGNRVTLTGAAFVPNALIGALINFVGLGNLKGIVYRNDATTLWFVAQNVGATSAVNPAVGSTVEILSRDTEIAIDAVLGLAITSPAATFLQNFLNCRFTGGPFDFCGGYARLDYCAVENGAGYYTNATAFYSCTYLAAVTSVFAASKVLLDAGVVLDGLGGATGLGVTAGGALELEFENAAIRTTGPAIIANGGIGTTRDVVAIGFLPSFSVLRCDDIGGVLSVNDPARGGAGSYGDWRLPDILAPTGGTGIPAGVLVDARSSARVTLGPGSNVTIGGVLNPVSIAGDTTKSADGIGTAIIGGTPAPGPLGPGVQLVVATGQTWDRVSRVVALDSSAIGAGGAFLLPAINTVSDGTGPVIKNIDGTNSVDIVPNGADLIDEVNAAVPTGAARAWFALSAQRSAANWMVQS